MGYRKPREIHYELTPRTIRRPVSVWRIIFAMIVGILILAVILYALYIVWHAYGRTGSPIYQKNGTEQVPIEPPRVVPRLPQRKHFEVIIAHYADNIARAEDVEMYLNRTLPDLIDRKIYSDLHISKVSSKGLQRNGNDPRMTLRVEFKHTVMMSSTVVVLSEQFPPTAEQIVDMVRRDRKHKICSPIDSRRCIEVCAVLVNVEDVPNITSADVGYEAVDIHLANKDDYAQNSAIYLQSDHKVFSLTRYMKDCY